MNTALILQLIAFAVTEGPVVIANVQHLIAGAQAIHAGQSPSDEQAALIVALASRKAAVDAANAMAALPKGPVLIPAAAAVVTTPAAIPAASPEPVAT